MFKLRFESKKDIWFIIIIWGTIIGFTLISIFGIGNGQSSIVGEVIGYVVMGLTISLLLWVWFGTGYIIYEEDIKIKSGPLRTTIKINEIQKIRKAKNPLSAPALAIDRLEIMYGKFNVAYISPRHEKEFIQVLIEKNPQIQLDDKLNGSVN